MSRTSSLYRIAWIFYLFLALAGLVGLAAEGRRVDLELLVRSASWWVDVALGLGSGAVLLAAWLLVRKLVPAASELEELLARLIGPVRRDELVALALMSAVAEEVAFRGALQTVAGVVVAALVFALLHLGPGAPFRLWSAYALVGGLVFGGVTTYRHGALAAAILGHLVVNLVQLRRIAALPAGDTAGLPLDA
jgi:membrane protease YdiL (CAAX protease family)